MAFMTNQQLLDRSNTSATQVDLLGFRQMRLRRSFNRDYHGPH
jgi:hypothetical protein